jgi:hypothetical protein
MNTGDGNFEKVVIELLVDILATNRDILDRINSIYEFDGDNNENRILVLEYLQEKYGELPKSLSDFLRMKGIDKPNK